MSKSVAEEAHHRETPVAVVALAAEAEALEADLAAEAEALAEAELAAGGSLLL